LFSHISEGEQEKIKTFAKSKLSFSHWRQQLADLGLKPRHSLASALLVTLVFVFVIRPAEASSKSLKNFARGNVALEQIETTKNLARGNIETEKVQRGNNCGGNELADCRDAAIEMVASRKPVFSFLLVISKIISPLTEFSDAIDHIPISAVRFESKLATQTQF
jgi:hypothetical protein